MRKKFCYKIFRQGEDVVLAISDVSMVGKTFEQEDLQLDVSREFYSQHICDKKEVIKLIESATIINAVGKEIISILLQEKLIEEDGILRVCGVPHAQIICIR